jgi:hypothetical protein
MTNKPVCKKCGKTLADPVSIACGMGPECRGGSGKSSSYQHPRYRKQVANARRAEAYSKGEPVIIGDTTYTKRDDGNWQDNRGRQTTDERLYDYLRRYDLIAEVDGQGNTFCGAPAPACGQDGRGVLQSFFTTNEGTAA